MSVIQPRKILFLNKAHPCLEERLSELGFECQFDFSNPKEIVEKNIHEYFGIVMRSRFGIDQYFLEKAKKLAFIAREGVGLEHIDVGFAQSKGIRLLISPEGSRDTVAEHAVGLLLCLLNNLNRADRQVRTGKWIREGNRAVELKNKTVGILGYGNMGASFAKKLAGFEVTVLAYDKFKTGYGDEFAQEVALERLFSEIDILSIHIPYSSDNHYFIDDSFLQNFRKNIFLINTARGLVLNSSDLVKHLKSGKVRGAALDVLEYEETSFENFSFEKLPPAFHYLIQAENVVLSPHIAGWSFESKEGHARVLAEKIGEAFCKANP